MLDELFELSGGTTIGRDHIFSRKPNQDAHLFAARPSLLAGVVCDGCGDPTSPHSEVGAQIAARTLLSNLFSVPRIDRDWLEIIRQHSLATIESLAQEMCGQQFGCRSEKDPRPQLHHILRDYFLFTVIGFAVTPEKAWFFSIGDGTLWVNGEQTRIGPFENNAPPYMTYALMDSSLLTKETGCLKFQVRKELPTEQLEHFLIGCDGVQELADKETELLPNRKGYVGNISSFWSDDKHFSNPDMINRKLFLINREFSSNEGHYHGLLRDDTTMVVGRRK